MIQQTKTFQRIFLCVVVCAVLASSGCGFLAQALYVIKGHESPAEFDGLEKKRVAVVVVSEASSYGADPLAHRVGNIVGVDLQKNVKDIDIVPLREIQEWIDSQGGNETDFYALGQDLGAERVLAIEIDSYTIHDGKTLYKGQSEITLNVYDIENGGRSIYVNGPAEFIFPENGRPAVQTSDRHFEQFYLAKLTAFVSRKFYPHDALDAVADDAAVLGY